MTVCNVFAWVLCAGLAYKGLRLPSTSDNGSTGSLLYDFYWGVSPFCSTASSRTCSLILTHMHADCKVKAVQWARSKCVQVSHSGQSNEAFAGCVAMRVAQKRGGPDCQHGAGRLQQLLTNALACRNGAVPSYRPVV
jgi:hypothetical protein